MKINLNSFRFRIIATLVIVVSLFSSVSIYIYNHYLFDKIYSDSERNIENILYFLQGEIIDVHDGRLIKPILEDLERDSGYIRVYLFDKEGNMTFPEEENIISSDTNNFNKLISGNGDIEVMTSHNRQDPSTLAVLKIHNQQECFECHAPKENLLGYVAMNISLTDTKNILGYSRAFSISYTIFIIIIILVFVIILHLRFIKKSLSSFQRSIQDVNEGNLDTRVTITKASELSNLGLSFNKMLDNFQRTQQELNRYHRQELENAEKLAAVGEMAARLAHDVRNPLTGISNSVEIIAGSIEDKQHQQILTEIRRQTTRVNEAITNLLKYARSTEITLRPGDINKLLENMVFFLSKQKQNINVDITLETDPDVPNFDFDQEQMENVLMNLCFNSIQAMDHEGELRIRTAIDDKKLMITIEDFGPGIPDDIKDEIFKPFFTTKTEGTGLGLSIARDMVKKHCGKLWYENKQKGGTAFYILMPLRTSGDEQ